MALTIEEIAWIELVVMTRNGEIVSQKLEKMMSYVFTSIIIMATFGGFDVSVAQDCDPFSPSAIITFPVGCRKLDETEVFYHIPEQPKGVIYLFHGSGGNARKFIRDVEKALFLRDAVALGFGVISMESADRNRKQWDTPDDVVSGNSVDASRVQIIHQRFVSDNANGYNENTPRFAKDDHPEVRSASS